MEIQITCLSINTVRKYLNEGGKPQYVRTKQAEHKLDPYKDYIWERIKAEHPVWLPATVLL